MMWNLLVTLNCLLLLELGKRLWKHARTGSAFLRIRILLSEKTLGVFHVTKVLEISPGSYGVKTGTGILFTPFYKTFFYSQECYC